MPFIEGEKLAKLYKEIDDERNASYYFRALNQSTKKKIAYVKVYAVGFYLLLLTVIVLGILFLSDFTPIDQSQEQPHSGETDPTVSIHEKTMGMILRV